MSPKKNAPDFGDRTLSPSGWQGWRERQNPRHGTLHQLKHAERRWATKPSSTYEKNLKKVDKAVVWKRKSFLICCKYPMFCWCLKPLPCITRPWVVYVMSHQHLRIVLALGRRTPESIDLPVPGMSKHGDGTMVVFFFDDLMMICRGIWKKKRRRRRRGKSPPKVWEK